MICYRDMTFCEADCETKECHRNKVHLPDDPPLPVMMCDFSKDCEKYKPKIARAVLHSR